MATYKSANGLHFLKVGEYLWRPLKKMGCKFVARLVEEVFNKGGLVFWIDSQPTKKACSIFI